MVENLRIVLIFEANSEKFPETMFEFDQYLGFLAIMTVLTIGFWLMIFLLTFVIPYWLGGSIIELIKEKREAKRAKSEK
ncbi:hypothetical protein [Galbibacter sp. PAP.153]